MDLKNKYVPDLSELFKLGVDFILFPRNQEISECLLHRTALEIALPPNALSYYAAAHSGLGLLYLKSGQLEYTSPSTGIPLTKDSLLLFRCDAPYQIAAGSAADYQILYFDGPGTSYYAARIMGEDFCFPWNPSGSLPSELRALFQREPQDPLRVHFALTKLLTQMALANDALPKKAPSYLTTIKKELETQYYQKYTLEELARKYSVNKYRICRDFKEYYQDTPLQYLHKIRVQASQDLLMKTDMKIHEISYEVGYENVNHYIHHFKKNMGYTPSEYRSRKDSHSL